MSCQIVVGLEIVIVRDSQPQIFESEEDMT